MEARDYRNYRPLSDGILNGLGISVAVHVAVFFLVLFLSRVMPAGEAPIQMCTVSLLAVQGDGIVWGVGKGGLMSKGNSEPGPGVPAGAPLPRRLKTPLNPGPNRKRRTPCGSPLSLKHLCRSPWFTRQWRSTRRGYCLNRSRR
jgi:hypothetical protein